MNLRVNEWIRMKVCLVVIFNHRYDKNLNRIRKLYAGRFSAIRFLVPFYDGTDKDVITVYDSSYQFQGFVAQARERLMNEGFEYYFFIADDLILNPAINENNFLTELSMKKGDSMHRGVFLLQDSLWTVERINDAIETFTMQVHTNYQNELMNKAEAIETMQKYGYGNIHISKENHKKMADWKGFTAKYGWKKTKQLKTLQELPYPLLGGYSDWFILPYEDLDLVSRKFGVTAAMRLFVEIAVPTIMFLYCKSIRRLRETKYKDGSIWDNHILEELGTNCNWQLEEMMMNFPEDKLYLHPIKLSKWS